jgi:hypothetical protein
VHTAAQRHGTDSPHPSANHVTCVVLGRWRSLPSSASARKQRSGDVDWVANRAGVHYVCRAPLFQLPREALLHLEHEVDLRDSGKNGPGLGFPARSRDGSEGVPAVYTKVPAAANRSERNLDDIPRPGDPFFEPSDDIVNVRVNQRQRPG